MPQPAIKSPTWFRLTLLTTLGGAVVGSGIALTQRDYSFFDPLVDVKVAINQRYVKGLDDTGEKKMQEAAIRGMVESLEDPYTVFVPPEDTREFQKDLTGQYVGIGVSINIRDGWLTVVSPLEDSPAFKLGLMADDRIVEIEGKSTFGLTADDCIDLLTGEPGTPVNIVYERAGVRTPLTIVRQRIVTRTIKGLHWQPSPPTSGADGKPDAASEGRWLHMIDEARKIAYIRVTQFTPTTADEFRETLLALGADKQGTEGMGGLIIDLRWNGGGVLQDAVAMADLFLNEGVIVTTRGRQDAKGVAKEERVERAEREGTLPEFPIAFLINGQSASASEIFTGALVDNDRAIAIGTRTFGKGLVQAVFSLPSLPGSQLKITEQRYYLPSGRLIQREESSTHWGVDPTPGFFVPMSDEELIELVRVRRQEEVLNGGARERAPGAGEERWNDAEWVLARLKDKQLAAAVKAVQGRVDTGAWAPTGQALPKNEDLVKGDVGRAALTRERLLRELERLDKRIDDMESAAGAKADASARDFWPDDADLAGGTLEVKDKDGKVVARLSITGNSLERWLIDADVAKPGEAAKPESSASPVNAGTSPPATDSPPPASPVPQTEPK